MQHNRPAAVYYDENINQTTILTKKRKSLTALSALSAKTNKISAFVHEIKDGLNWNFLKLNMDKRSFLTGNPSLTSNISTDFTCENVGIHIKPSSTVKNVGVISDSSLSFQAQINSITKCVFFHQRRIPQLYHSQICWNCHPCICLITSNAFKWYLSQSHTLNGCKDTFRGYPGNAQWWRGELRRAMFISANLVKL